MFEVNTVFIIATRRGSYPVLDILRSIRWSCAGSHYTVIVDRGKNVEVPEDIKDGYTILTIDQDTGAQDQFVAGLGLKWCIDKGVQADQYIMLDDKCLITQRGLDAWSLDNMQRTGLGLVGVKDRLNFEDAYAKVSPLMDRWDMPHALFLPGRETVHEAALFMSGGLIKTLFDKNLLVPEGAEQWPLPYGPFISWAAQMHGFYQVGWGHMDQPMPPLYINHTKHSRYQPAPHILNTQFRLYYSVRHVAGYSEERLRESFKKMRGEPAKDFDPVRPTVAPKPIGPPAHVEQPPEPPAEAEQTAQQPDSA
jgi:hypothetical protein